MLRRMSACVLLAALVPACEPLIGNVQDGAVGFGEAIVENQSDTEFEVELGMTYVDDVAVVVEAGGTEVITNLNGNFGTGPQICMETTTLRITRTSDGTVLLDEECDMERWKTELGNDYQDNYEADYRLVIDQAMVDAASLP